ncbi:MAG: hypothetical protein ACKVTZ_06355 [Bacteroidia bacterium]
MTRFYLAFIFVFISIPILSYLLNQLRGNLPQNEQKELEQKIEEIGENKADLEDK